MISHLEIKEIKKHYNKRKSVHKELEKYLKVKNIGKYVNLALGISDLHGNYSANEHKLGPKILHTNSPNSVFCLAKKLLIAPSVHHVPEVIYKANIQYLKIGVGSEMAMMLKPKEFWVANIRSIWAHLLIKHDWDYDRANEELSFYRVDDLSSEMAYNLWRDIYLAMEKSMNQLADLGNSLAKENNVKPGKQKFIWADAIANALYEND